MGNHITVDYTTRLYVSNVPFYPPASGYEYLAILFGERDHYTIVFSGLSHTPLITQFVTEFRNVPIPELPYGDNDNLCGCAVIVTNQLLFQTFPFTTGQKVRKIINQTGWVWRFRDLGSQMLKGNPDTHRNNNE